MTIRTSSYGKRIPARPGTRPHRGISMPVRIIVLFVGFIMLVGLAGAGIYGVSQWLCKSPFFTVTGVTINGCSRVSEETVLKLSGVKPDSNLLALDLDQMAETIEKHPWIESASISKKLPDRLEIVVRERVPVAMINLDALYLIDASGAVFKKISSNEQFDLPVITGVSSIPEKTEKDNSGQSGAQSEGARPSAENLKRALEIIALASKGTRTLGINDVSEIHIDQQDIILYTADKGLPLRFSGDAPLKLQFQRAEKILYHLYSSGKFKKIVMVDLNYGNDTALARIKN